MYFMPKLENIFLFLSCWGLLWARIVEMDNDKPPNIVIILADDMGFDDVSFHGGSKFITPNIDAVAYHGKILNRMYAPPMCTPSRSALLTGLYPFHTGTQHYVIVNEEPWSIPLNVTTMSEVFQASGYSTNLLGKWHLGFGRKEFTPTYRGFDYHFGYWGAYIDYFRYRSQMPTGSSLGYDLRRNMDLECPSNATYFTDLLTLEAERIIANNRGQQPLFLIVSHLAVHTANDDEPLQAPPEEIEKFSYISNTEERTYAAMISKLDESVGRIVQALDEVDMLRNTILIFYSDNGAPAVGMFNNTGSNWPFRGQKNSPWEGGLRVAGAIWSPLLKNRASIFQQTLHVTDWLPTLAAAANINLAKHSNFIDGINLWPELVKSKTITPLAKLKQREIVHFLDDIEQVASLTRGQFKYINGTTLDGLYDHVLSSRVNADIDPREKQYVAYVENSTAARVLRQYDDLPLTRAKITKLRRLSDVQCGRLLQATTCSPLTEECLFNVWQDPCEQNNLAGNSKYGKILNEMRSRVVQLRASAWPPANQNGVIDNDPSRHYCTWTNFLDINANEEILECGYSGPPCS